MVVIARIRERLVQVGHDLGGFDRGFLLLLVPEGTGLVAGQERQQVGVGRQLFEGEGARVGAVGCFEVQDAELSEVTRDDRLFVDLVGIR